EYDAETQLDYAFARYYSPRLARFLSTDPLGGSLGNLQSHSAYAYTQNNPLNSVDPLGLWCTGEPNGGTCTSPGGGIGFFDMLNFGIQVQVGTLYGFNGPTNFHFADYSLSELLNLASHGEVSATITPIYEFLPLFGGLGDGSRAMPWQYRAAAVKI